MSIHKQSTAERLNVSPPSLTAAQVKHLRGLQAKKVRYQHRQFVAEGATIVTEIIGLRPTSLRYVVCTPEYYQQLDSAAARALHGQIFFGDANTLKRISSLDTPPAVLALLDMPDASLLSPSDQPASRPSSVDQAVADTQQFSPMTGLHLYLDGIRDPGNLGTILRVADWFGHAQVFLSDDCVDPYNSKTIQASMGAFMRVRTQFARLDELRAAHPQLSIVGTRIEGGEDGLNCAWQRETLLVIGSESHGIRPEQQAAIGRWLSIPRGAQHSGSESLNAAVAAGILCAAYLAGRRT